jgi:hypothetical protein
VTGRSPLLPAAHWSKRLAAAGALLALLLAPPMAPAAAAASPDAIAEAKTLFRAGAQAYADADYDAALHAFEAARARVPDPALTFSIAQAHRRQYEADQSIGHLRRAIAEYRRYLAEVPKGGRRGDAADALAALEKKLAAAEEESYGFELEKRKATRLMVLSSVEGAQVSVDDAPPETAPFIGEVEVGAHTIRVVADGYRPYVRSVVVRAGDVVPVDANLEALPAQLLIRGDEGATVWVDGRPRGELPLTSPLAVDPGRRLIGVTQEGHRRFELEMQLHNGEAKQMDVALETTAQRTLSLVTLVLAGGSLATAAVMGGVAGAIYQDHRDLEDELRAGGGTPGDLAEYNAGRSSHRPYAAAAIATGVIGLGLGVTGGLLYLIDDPAPASQVGRAEGHPVRIAVDVAPAPEGAHAGVTLRF